MKNYIFVLLMLLNWGLNAQSRQAPTSIFVGFYGPYIIQPGVKVGTTIPVVQWVADKGEFQRERNLFVSPQIGGFFRPGNHTSFILNADLGLQFHNKKGSLYSAPSLGLGWLVSNQLLDSSVPLNTGGMEDENRALRSYFLPTLNVEVGARPNKGPGWYTKFSYGRRFSTEVEASGFFAIEIGAQFALGKSDN